MSAEAITWLDRNLGALTPMQRWQAAKGFDAAVLTGPWFILSCVVALLVMISLLLWVSLRRVRREQKTGNHRNRRPGSGQSHTLSSRGIPLGQRVILRPCQGSDIDETEAEVVQTTQESLTLRLASPVTIMFGSLWRVCYYIGSTVWAFDTEVQSYDGSLLTLKHSDQGRFMNRRRFLRVPVKYPGLIAKFDFEYLPSRDWSSHRTVTHGTRSGHAFGLNHQCIPLFVPATVTEVAGPGLSLDSSLDVRRGERILVIFDPHDEAAVRDAAAHRSDRRMIADVAEVRHTRAHEHGLSIAVELSEAKGSEVSELIRLTNTALVRIQEQKNAGRTRVTKSPVVEAAGV